MIENLEKAKMDVLCIMVYNAMRPNKTPFLIESCLGKSRFYQEENLTRFQTAFDHWSLHTSYSKPANQDTAHLFDICLYIATSGTTSVNIQHHADRCGCTPHTQARQGGTRKCLSPNLLSSNGPNTYQGWGTPSRSCQSSKSKWTRNIAISSSQGDQGRCTYLHDARDVSSTTVRLWNLNAFRSYLKILR